MSAVLTTFGIDWRLLLVNAVNFGVLMFALWYFLYAPVMRMLEERRRKIAGGVAAARAAEDRLREVEGSRQKMLADAGKEADAVLAETRAAAAAKERELVERGAAAAEALLADAQAQARELKARVIEESKKEVAKLVVLGIERTHAK